MIYSTIHSAYIERKEACVGMFGIVGGAIVLFGNLYLVREILRGNRASLSTWVLWSVICWATFFSQIYAGKDDIWGIFGAAVGTTFVAATLIFYGKKTWSLLDTCVTIAVACGFVLWYVAGPALAQVALVVMLNASGLPAMKEAIEYPETESPVPWGIFACGFFITLFSVLSWGFSDYTEWVQPVSATAFHTIMFLLAVRKPTLPQASKEAPSL